MAPGEWKQFGEVLITWGFWAIVYGIVTMCIGFVILVCLDITVIKKVVKFIK